MEFIDKVTIWHDIQNPVYYLLRYGPKEHPEIFAQLAKMPTVKLLVNNELESRCDHGVDSSFVVMSEDAATMFILKYSELVKFTITHAEMARGMVRLSQIFIRPLSMMKIICNLKAAGKPREYDVIMGHIGDTSDIPEHYRPFLIGLDKLLNRIDERE